MHKMKDISFENLRAIVLVDKVALCLFTGVRIVCQARLLCRVRAGPGAPMPKQAGLRGGS